MRQATLTIAILLLASLLAFAQSRLGGTATIGGTSKQTVNVVSSGTPYILTPDPTGESPNGTAFSGLGCHFTATGTPTVNALGRWKFTGDTFTHTVSFYQYVDGSPGNDILLASASVSMSTSTVGQYNYVAVTPFTLTNGTNYYILSDEPANTDSWAEITGITVTAGIGDITFAVYRIASGTLQFNDAGTKCYVPVNFKIQ